MRDVPSIDPEEYNRVLGTSTKNKSPGYPRPLIFRFVPINLFVKPLELAGDLGKTTG